MRLNAFSRGLAPCSQLPSARRLLGLGGPSAGLTTDHNTCTPQLANPAGARRCRAHCSRLKQHSVFAAEHALDTKCSPICCHGITHVSSAHADFDTSLFGPYPIRTGRDDAGSTAADRLATPSVVASIIDACGAGVFSIAIVRVTHSANMNARECSTLCRRDPRSECWQRRVPNACSRFVALLFEEFVRRKSVPIGGADIPPVATSVGR
jgi:hypothetical protein